jgi:glycosyltransferase involved in cell wall biosynthesis
MNRRGRRYLRLRHQLGRFSSLNVVVSRNVYRDLLSRGFVDRNIFLHYIGVDVRKFTRNPATVRENIVLFVGRLVEMKGCEYAIRAMAAVQQEFADTRLVIIGDGPLRQSLETLARQLNCRCEFLGVQPPENVREWMSRARVFCTPSVVAKSGNVETFGIVFIEAQAMELPVVSTTAGGIPEAVENGITGLLAPERDWRTLAAHLHTMLMDRVAWKKFSVAGRERVVRQFNLESQTRILEQKYDQVIEGWLSTGIRSSPLVSDELTGELAG